MEDKNGINLNEQWRDIDKKINKKKKKSIVLLIIISSLTLLVGMIFFFYFNKDRLHLDNFSFNMQKEKISSTIEETSIIKTESELMEVLITSLQNFDKDGVLECVDYDIDLSLNSNIKNVYKDSLKELEYEKNEEDLFKITYMDISDGIKEAIKSEEDANVAFTNYYKANKPTKKTLEIKPVYDEYDSTKLLLTKEILIMISSGIVNAIE